MCSAAVLSDPALPGRSAIASASPPTPATVNGERRQGESARGAVLALLPVRFPGVYLKSSLGLLSKCARPRR
jgi:hypothetical protein